MNEEVLKTLDSPEPFCFMAGAGSGKTTALIGVLNLLLQKYFLGNVFNGKKICVITYTNAGVDEIKKRIGQTAFVEVSTIHERLWSSIQNFQEVINAGFGTIVDDQICKQQGTINEKKAQKFVTLPQITALMNDKTQINTLYSTVKKDEIERFFPQCQALGMAATKFREVCLAQHKLLQLKIVRDELNSGTSRAAVYEPTENFDRLSSFHFSHDSLLKIAKYVFENSSAAIRVFNDKYPYLLIDEYQDTSPEVFGVVKTLMGGSHRQPKIMFFGDPFQRIYEKGFDGDICDAFAGLKPYFSKNNYRSQKQIVDVANAFRTYYLKEEGHQQLVGNPASNHGSVLAQWGNASEENEESFINKWVQKVKEELKICPANPLVVFLLKYDLISKKEHFGSLYSLLKSSPHYQGAERQNAATEIINDDKKKLGRASLALIKLFTPIAMLESDGSINSFLTSAELAHLKTADLKNCSDLGNLLQSETIGGYAENIDRYLSNPILLRMANESLSSLSSDGSQFSSALFFKQICQHLSDGIHSFEIQKLKEIPFSELRSYYRYLFNCDNEEVQYVTWQSTKGREFKNVALVMTESFGLSHSFFYQAFQGNDLSNDKKAILARNLLYVGLTRAKENLRILYLHQNLDKDGKFDEMEKMLGGSITEFSL